MAKQRLAEEMGCSLEELESDDEDLGFPLQSSDHENDNVAAVDITELPSKKKCLEGTGVTGQETKKSACSHEDSQLDKLLEALHMLKDPKVLEAITSIMQTPSAHIPMERSDIKLGNLKTEDKDDSKLHTPEVTPTRCECVMRYNDICLEFSSPKTQMANMPKDKKNVN